MEISDLSMEQLHLRVVWRFAGMRPGALCVIICGQDLMHKWPADSWDTQQLVWNILIIITETAVIQCVLNFSHRTPSFDTFTVLPTGSNKKAASCSRSGSKK